jgi:hypothetical protein
MTDATGLTLQEFPEIGRWHACLDQLEASRMPFPGQPRE